MRHNRRPKISYATQVATNPPTIVLFTNGPGLFDATYRRYLLKAFRDHLAFRDVPLQLYLRHKHREEEVPDGKKKQPAPSKPRKRDRQAPELWKDL
jgi:GTP-binding protein